MFLLWFLDSNLRGSTTIQGYPHRLRLQKPFFGICLVGHSISSQPPDGQHVTDFAEILHTIWDTKKIPEPEDERSETSETGDMAP